MFLSRSRDARLYPLTKEQPFPPLNQKIATPLLQVLSSLVVAVMMSLQMTTIDPLEHPMIPLISSSIPTLALELWMLHLAADVDLRNESSSFPSLERLH